MWNYGAIQSRAFWSEIPFITGSGDGIIRLCPAKTNNGIEVDAIEVDIFEHTIHQIICQILDRHRRDENIGEVHIILDMPPSYEKHAEGVLKHLLINEESDLFRKAKNRKDQFYVNQKDETRYYLPYEIRLYMMCARNPAHVEQNGIYLYHWLQRRKYSDAITDLIKDKEVIVKYLSDKSDAKSGSGEDDKPDKEITPVVEPISRFLVRFIVNDIAGNFWESKAGRQYSADSEFKQYSEWAAFYFSKKEKEPYSYYLQAKKRFEALAPGMKYLFSFRALPHVSLPATYWEMEAENAPPKRIIEIEKDNINPLEYVEEVIIQNSGSEGAAP